MLNRQTSINIKPDKHLSKSRSKCKSAIHVTIHQQSIDRPKSVTASVSVIKVPRHSRSLSEPSENNPREIHSSSKNKNGSIEQNDQIMSETKKQQLSSSKTFHHKKSNVNGFNQFKVANICPNQIGTINDYHQQQKNNKKAKCTRKSIFFSTIGTFVLVSLAVTIVLVIILIKSKPTMTKVSVLRWNPIGITVAGVTGSGGTDSNQLNVPWDIALDWSNNLYIVDRLNNRVQKFLRNASNGTTIAGQLNASSGSSLNDLNNPAGIIVDENSNIYISDESNHRIVYWLKDASSGSLITGTTGISGSANNQLYNPQGLTRDSNADIIYVADYLNQRIMSYRAGISLGTLAAGGNGAGINNTQLWGPVAVHFDSWSNSLLIANFASNNIVRWILGDSTWTLLAGSSDGTSGNTSTLFWEPSDVTLDPMGNMYIVDRHNHRVQFFPVGQSTGVTIAGITGKSGINSTLLDSPTSLVLDNQLNLYVVDCLNHRIQQFLRY